MSQSHSSSVTTDNRILRFSIASFITAIVSLATMAFTVGTNYEKFTTLVEDQKQMKDTLNSISRSVLVQTIMYSQINEKVKDHESRIKELEHK